MITIILNIEIHKSFNQNLSILDKLLLLPSQVKFDSLLHSSIALRSLPPCKRMKATNPATAKLAGW
jgi:hypothetical protein